MPSNNVEKHKYTWLFRSEVCKYQIYSKSVEIVPPMTKQDIAGHKCTSTRLAKKKKRISAKPGPEPF